MTLALSLSAVVLAMPLAAWRGALRSGRRIAELPSASRLPAVYTMPGAMEACGLVAYGPASSQLSRGAAVDVGRPLKGSPADRRVQQVTTSELTANVKAVVAPGLTVPPDLLEQAAQVVQ